MIWDRDDVIIPVKDSRGIREVRLSHEDVELVRVEAVQAHPDTGAKLHSLADRIESLLPPKRPA